ncbi:MAG TPA: hypothetical protein VG408_06350 [Actinomycetota bacterium]|nr:hypothetical protein [Actinomycetota bacterium]
MATRRVPSLLVAGVLAVIPLAACDKEDRADVREGVNEVEDVVDDEVDTDGKDD